MADRAAKDGFPAFEYISEDDLETFDGWLTYQAIDPSSHTEEDVAGLREIFNGAVKTRETARRVGRMKLKAQPGESKYAVAIREGDVLWLALWVRRSPKPEFFVFQPRGDRDCNRGPLRRMLRAVLADHPNSALSYLGGLPTRSCHGLHPLNE
jgi:hypothetical protein